MEYRTAKRTDLNEIMKLYKQLNPDDKEIEYKKALSIWDISESSNIMKYFVALDSLTIVACCNIAIIPNLTRNGRPYAIIENVITDSSYRRKGIGKKIIENAIQYAKINNCYKICLMSNKKRKEAHIFYEDIGFNGNSKMAFEIRIEELT